MRMGKKKQPTYRVVAADKRKARNGSFIEIIGFYNPRSEPSVIDIDNDKAVKWLTNGAQPSERVEKLLKHSLSENALVDFRNNNLAAPLGAPAESGLPLCGEPKCSALFCFWSCCV